MINVQVKTNFEMIISIKDNLFILSNGFVEKEEEFKNYKLRKLGYFVTLSH